MFWKGNKGLMMCRESLDKMIREEKMKKVDDKSEMMNQSKQNHREIEVR